MRSPHSPFSPGPRRRERPFAALSEGGGALWISGMMWAVTLICFMVAMSLTRVANVPISPDHLLSTSGIRWRIIGGGLAGLQQALKIVLEDDTRVVDMFAHQLFGTRAVSRDDGLDNAVMISV